MTKHYRTIFAVVLVLITVLVLNVNSVAAAKVKKPLTYTPEQLEQIETYAIDLQEMRDRMSELGVLINRKDWIYARNFIHGPLGELRISMLNLSRNLLPDAQASAKTLAKDVFDDLVAIDGAAQNQNFPVAIRKYAETLKGFDAFLALIPPGAQPKKLKVTPLAPAPSRPQPVSKPQVAPPVKATAPEETEPEAIEPEAVEAPVAVEAES